MAKVSNINRATKKLKYKIQNHNICKLCGRSRWYIRRFGLCRLCFRELAYKGELPGVVKASW